MSDSIRIRTTPNGSDKYIKVNLEQKFDFIEILSLKISQEDAYRKFCSDYGVVVGRVTVNNGFGVPNAKVSVFIPLDDIDKNNPEIKGLYPYEIITDTNDEGVRYNLLPKDSVTDNPCFTPIGTFPNKREVLDNPLIGEIYCKYYKFTTTTNHAGDFMIFGVPLGTYTLHVDADISDIGIISQRPFDLISQGTPAKLFESTTKFKGEKNLDRLIQVKTMNAGINVQPFWGDVDNCKIGINRLDFSLNLNVRPSAIFIGSIFGDQDKNSVNKSCRPRRKLGEICEQITGEGTINMIRKTIDGKIEEFDVEGGRVIDEDGTWSYQIPMNLDYKITDENGDLIPSQDPNIGIPTRASVRFKIGLDETGGAGRLRTRAKYLVPNNPKDASEVDYAFGPASEDNPIATKDTSFRDLYWNKIYTVANYIPRFQGSNLGGAQSFTGIKNVDACAGTKTPFPYNRVNTELNPLFSIICLIMWVLAYTISIINAVIIVLLNTLIGIVKLIIEVLCYTLKGLVEVANFIGFNFRKPSWCDSDFMPFIPCVTIPCSVDDDSNESAPRYAPGCFSKGPIIKEGYESAVNIGNKEGWQIIHWAGDGDGQHSADFSVGLIDCTAYKLAKKLGMYQFDFYNDWVNGTLYSYLLRYKKKKKRKLKKSKEKFCEYECDGGSFDAIDGVDSGGNNKPDNHCNHNFLIDSCLDDSNRLNNHKTYDNIKLSEGLIKKVGDDLIYASTTHFGYGVEKNLFATDIINLGSIFDCDWQNIPKISQYLTPSSYILPPDGTEYTDSGVKEVCGMISPGEKHTDSLFFSINCVGLHVSMKGCLNIRHQCEFGVDLDEGSFDASGVYTEPDCALTANDIDDDSGKYVRDVIYGLNNGTQWTQYGTWNTDFNTNISTDYYKYTSANGVEYNKFRGYYDTNNNPKSDTTLIDTEHSYYFYFGLSPSKTAVDKMNSKYFTSCIEMVKDSMLIQAEPIADKTGTGAGIINLSVIGGVGPFTYTITGPNFSTGGTMTTNISITGLNAGTYEITVTDSMGALVKQTIVITGVPKLFATIEVTKNATTDVSLDGEITISNVYGGNGPITYKIYKADGSLVRSGNAPATITGLLAQNTGGYSVTITDGTQIFTVGSLLVLGIPALALSSTKTDITCSGFNNGKLELIPSGGKPIYALKTTGPSSYNSNSGSMVNLVEGTYVSEVTDSLGSVVQISTVIAATWPKITLTPATSSVLRQQCNSSYHKITVYLDYSFNPPANYSLSYKVDNINVWFPVTGSYLGANSPITFNIPFMAISIAIKATNGPCESEVLSISKSSVTKPSTNLNGSITTTGPDDNGYYVHNITGYGGIGTISGTGSITDQNSSITQTLTDGVGCTKNITG